MLDSKGFDLWAENYDVQVGLADENNDYPFAGYKDILGQIYAQIMAAGPGRVLDVGVGTATLAAKLHQAGHEVVGVDFSEEMLKIAARKMPGARLICHDFEEGLPKELAGQKFDFIVLTYALHHLEDGAKCEFIREVLGYLAPKGTLIIGDIAFETAEARDKCRADCGEDSWDDDEFYIAWADFAERLKGWCKAEYRQVSHCGGIIQIKSS